MNNQTPEPKNLENWRAANKNYRTSPAGKLKYLELTTGGIFSDEHKRELIISQGATPFLRPAAAYVTLLSAADLLIEKNKILSNKKLFGGGLLLSVPTYFLLMVALPMTSQHNRVALSRTIFGKYSQNISCWQAHA